MKNIKKRLIGLTLGLALSLGVGIGIASSTHSEIARVEAAVVEIVSVTMTDGSNVSGSHWTIEKQGIKIDCSNGAISAENMRVYKTETLTVSSSDGSLLTKAEFTATANGTAKYGPGYFTGDNYTASDKKREHGNWLQVHLLFL